MTTCTYNSTFTHRGNTDIDEILERYDPYIKEVARKKVPRNVVPPEVLNYEIDELAQRVRIKLWSMLEKKCITNPKAYISRIMYTEVVDMVRQYQSTLPLSLDDDGELYQGDMIATPSEGMGDPAYEFEQAERFDHLTYQTFEAVMKLPCCQQRAMIWSLKTRLDNPLPLMNMLSKYVVNVDEIKLPQDKDELRSFRTSLSIARRKLKPRFFKEEYAHRSIV